MSIALLPTALAQGVITTAVGADAVFQDTGRAALQARIGRSEGVVVDAAGTVYFSDYDNSLVFKVGSDGFLRVAAGNGLSGYSGDGGPATGARLDFPLRLAVDSKGNLFVMDSSADRLGSSNGRVRKITPDGIISTVAGGNGAGFSGDNGPAVQASFSSPRGIAVDPTGNLYIADTLNHRIRKVTPDGVIRTIAGTGTQAFSGDGGPATSAALNTPYAVAVDASGNVFIADYLNNRVRKISASNSVISTVLSLTNVTGVQVDSAGVVYATGVNRVVMLAPDGTSRVVVGNGAASGFSGDGGKATAAALAAPLDAAPGPNGSLYIADTGNFRIRAVDASGNISTFAGNGQFRVSPEGTLATSSLLYNPNGVSFDPAGNLYIADSSLNRIRKVTPAGVVFTFAGNGVVGAAADGSLATQSPLNTPYDVAADANGNVYISDSFNNAIRKVDSRGVITRVAGGGTNAADGMATSVLLNLPEGIALDSLGSLYFAETGASRVRKLAPDGRLTTVAGGGAPATLGADGVATSVALNAPIAVGIDGSGNLYIADYSDNRVRKVTTDGKITTFAGNGAAGATKEGVAATSTFVTAPAGITFDAQGNVYVSAAPGKILRIDSKGVVTTFAGIGVLGFSGDGGLAIAAMLNLPSRMTFDSAGNLYFADAFNNRVRVVLQTATTFQATPASFSFSGSAGGSATAAQSLSLATSVPGVAFSVTTALPSWLSVTPSSGTLPASLQIVADPSSLAAGTYLQTLAISVPSASPAVRTVSVVFTVGPSTAPKLSVATTSLSFAFGVQSGPDEQQITVANSGGGSLAVTAAAATSSGGTWLSVVTASGTATPGNPVLIPVRAAPGTLAPGVYLGTVSITSSTTGESATVAVTMTVSAVRQSIQLSQSGLTFTVVANGGFVLPQSFAVLNTGQGVMNWTAAASTLSGGPWLSLTPATGATDASSNVVPFVQVSINAARLTAGAYYGRVTVSAPAADNSPQFVLVVLNVLPGGTSPGPLVQPTSVIFTGVAGGPSPSSQTILIGNPTGAALTYRSGSVTLDGANWFLAAPQSGIVPTDQPATIVLQPDITNLTPGVRRGILALLFSDGSSRVVNLLLVLTGAGGNASPASMREVSNCTPTKLLPLINTVGQDFNIPAAWPTALVAKIVDDCKNPMTTGSVTASFSNGDLPISLISIKDGTWSGTWQPRNATGSLTTITISAQTPEQNIQGSFTLSGNLQQNVAPPQLNPGGVVSAASFAQAGVLAPGSFVSIYGARFADGLNVATEYPLATSLIGTEVILGGRSLPLYFTSSGQINAIVPIDVPVNARLQLAVIRGSTSTGSESVSIAAAQPAVFTPGQTGTGQGYIFVHDAAGVETLADSSKPAQAGDVVVTYCAGLGLTNPSIAAGVISPAALSPTVNAVTMTIGGKDANVFFAGLAPGFVGLYQVNATVPAGVTSGAAVPVVLSVGGQNSPPVTMAVR